MPASRQTQDYIEKELPYKILMSIYKNSRASLRELGENLGISYHVIQSILKRMEEEYKITYSLELDESKLGFTEGRMITIKFGRMPNVDFLKEKFQKDIFVQNAYLAEGDFDVVFYVVGLSSKDFSIWYHKLRVDLAEYAPVLKFSVVDASGVGFLPLRNELMNESTVLSSQEKKVLTLLNSNSRMRLKDIITASGLNQMKVLYIIKKLKTMGIIKKFSALTQNPDKRLFFMYTLSNTPGKTHRELLLKFLKELVSEDLHEVSNDYCLIMDVTGAFDAIYFCDFLNGEILSKRGPGLIQTLWAEETPAIEKAILTSVLVGKWPFHLVEYEVQNRVIKAISKEMSLTD